MCFMATVVHKMMADVLAAEAPISGLAVSSIMLFLRMRQVIAYDGQYATTEPTKMMNIAYKAFGVKCPDVIRDPAKSIVVSETGGKSG